MIIEKNTGVLQRALNYLKNIYSEERLKPGVVRKIGLKRGWNVVIGSEEQCGIALNFTGMHDVYNESVRSNDTDRLRSLVGLSLFDAAERMTGSGSLQERSIGLACLNALSQPLRTDASLKKRGLPAEFKKMDAFIQKTDIVTVIGHGGIVRELFGKCAEIHVTDMRPANDFETIIIGDSVKTGPECVCLHKAEENRELLSRSDIVMITGSTLVNDTFDQLVEWSIDARIRMLYGPSAMLDPGFLFNAGLNLVQFASISNPERFEFDMINDMDMEAALKINQIMKHEFAGFL